MLNPLTHDFLVAMSKKLFNAAVSGDSDFAIATLSKLQEQIPLVLEELKGKVND